MERLHDGCLSGMTTLLICPSTFCYEKAIAEVICSLGGSVIYIDERPGNDFFTKGLIRTNPGLLHRQIARYYSSKLNSIDLSIEIDKVLVINPEALSESIVLSIRHKYPKAELILYMWDSFQNKPSIIEMLYLFDRVLSFDRNDCDKFPNISFRPLFFLPPFEAIPRIDKPRYDIAFIGTIHSDRFAVCKRVAKVAEQMGLRMFQYLFLNDKKLYWYSRVTNQYMHGSKASDFHYVPLPRDEVIEVFKESLSLLDIQHPRQTGLTMRTIEVLGAKRKLLTTNMSIKNYDFYSSDNVLVIDREYVKLNGNFFANPVSAIDPYIYYKYSVHGWIKDILALE